MTETPTPGTKHSPGRQVERLVAIVGAFGAILAGLSGLDPTVQIIVGTSVAAILVGAFLFNGVKRRK